MAHQILSVLMVWRVAKFVGEIAPPFEAAFEVLHQGQGTFQVLLIELAALFLELARHERRDLEPAGELFWGGAAIEQSAGAGDELELATDHEREAKRGLARADQVLKQRERSI